MPQPIPPRPPSPAATMIASAFSILAALTCFGGTVGAVLDNPGEIAAPADGLPAAAMTAPGPWPAPAPAVPLAPAAVTLAPAAAGAAPPGQTDAGSPAGRPGLERRTVDVERGDTLSSVLTRAGVSAAEGQAALAALRSVFEPRALRAGGTVEVALATGADTAGPRLMEMAVAADPQREARVARGSDGAFSASVRALALDRVPALASGVITSSLFADAAAAGAPDAVILEMIRAFSYDVDFQRDIHPGDRFSILFETVSGSDGRILGGGNLLYAGLVLAGEEHGLYRHVDAAGEADYYSRDGRSVRTALLRTPINGARLSSAFGMRRHPVLGFSRMHRGIDFAAPTGTPIYAAGDGRVGFVGRNSGYGNYVRIDHAGGYATAYGHLSRFAAGLKPGGRVNQGQVIGHVGSTGVSTGPHLHYEILVDGRQVNPLEVKALGRARLPAEEMGRFAGTIAEVDGHHLRLAGGPLAAAGEHR